MKEHLIDTRKIIASMVMVIAGLIALLMPTKVHAAGVWEKENNDVMGNADAIALNQMVKGTLKDKTDEDWYKFTITENGYFTVCLSPDASTDTSKIKNGWMFEVQDSDRHVMKIYRRITTTMTTKAIAFRPGTYYIRLKTYNSSSPVNCIYNLKVDFVSDAMWNTDSYYGSQYETFGYAMPAYTGEIYSGTLYDAKDKDYFKYNFAGNGKMQIRFDIDDNVQAEEIKSGWRIKVYDKDKREVYKTKKSVKTSETLELMDYNGCVYVEVGSYSGSCPVDALYHVSVTSYVQSAKDSKAVKSTGSNSGKVSKTAASVKVKKTALKKVRNVKGRKVALTWKKAGNVTGYQIQYSYKKSFAGKKMKTIRNTKKTTYTLRKLKKKRTCYVRIRSFRQYRGKTHYSSWSAVKKVKIRK